jgi:hypothetical protein
VRAYGVAAAAPRLEGSHEDAMGIEGGAQCGG